jgi:hypothetical protein
MNSIGGAFGNDDVITRLVIQRPIIRLEPPCSLMDKISGIAIRVAHEIPHGFTSMRERQADVEALHHEHRLGRGGYPA